jgi:hypothetical protein
MKKNIFFNILLIVTFSLNSSTIFAGPSHSKNAENQSNKKPLHQEKEKEKEKEKKIKLETDNISDQIAIDNNTIFRIGLYFENHSKFFQAFPCFMVASQLGHLNSASKINNLSVKSPLMEIYAMVYEDLESNNCLNIKVGQLKIIARKFFEDGIKLERNKQMEEAILFFMVSSQLHYPLANPKLKSFESSVELNNILKEVILNLSSVVSEKNPSDVNDSCFHHQDPNDLNQKNLKNAVTLKYFQYQSELDNRKAQARAAQAREEEAKKQRKEQEQEQNREKLNPRERFYAEFAKHHPNMVPPQQRQNNKEKRFEQPQGQYQEPHAEKKKFHHQDPKNFVPKELSDESRLLEFFTKHGIEVKDHSESAIKTAYYKAALLLHPDKNPADKKEKFEVQFKELQILWNKYKHI